MQKWLTTILFNGQLKMSMPLFSKMAVNNSNLFNGQLKMSMPLFPKNAVNNSV